MQDCCKLTAHQSNNIINYLTHTLKWISQIDTTNIAGNTLAQDYQVHLEARNSTFGDIYH